MKSSEWIIKEMNELTDSYPFIKIKYENHTLSNSHFLTIEPNNNYAIQFNRNKIESEFVLRFIDKFPKESICFLNEKSFYKIEKIDHQSIGREFEEIKHIDTSYSISDYFDKIRNDKIVLGSKINSEISYFYELKIVYAKGVSDDSLVSFTFIEDTNDTSIRYADDVFQDETSESAFI